MSEEILKSRLLAKHGFVHGFSTRLGGSSEGPYASLNLAESVGDSAQSVDKNRAHFAKLLGLRVAQIFEVEQVHGKRVRVLGTHEEREKMRTEQADALLSRHAHQALAIRTADCIPVLLAHIPSRSVAAVHVGWRGAVAGILTETVRVWDTSGEELIAAIGPHIRKKNFEVGADVAKEIQKAMPDAQLVERDKDRIFADLSLLVQSQLIDCGLLAENIEDVGGDTFSDATRFFSHRRDRGITGRHWALIATT